MLICVTALLLEAPHHHDAFFVDGQPCAAPPEGPPDRWILEATPRGSRALVLAPELARGRLIRERAEAGWPRPESVLPGWRQRVGLGIAEREALVKSEGRAGLARMLAVWAGVAA